MRSPARVQGFFVYKCQGVPPRVADVTSFASLKAGEMERRLQSAWPCAKAVETFFAYNVVIRRATPFGKASFSENVIIA